MSATSSLGIKKGREFGVVRTPISTESGRTNLLIAGNFPRAQVNTAFYFKPVVSGGSGPKVFKLTGTLPPGLFFDTTNGSIFGTPVVIGTTNGITISVADDTNTVFLANRSLFVDEFVYVVKAFSSQFSRGFY